jgi:hypothetical protein
MSLLKVVFILSTPVGAYGPFGSFGTFLPHVGHFRSTSNSGHLWKLPPVCDTAAAIVKLAPAQRQLSTFCEIVYNAHCETMTAHRASGGRTRHVTI